MSTNREAMISKIETVFGHITGDIANDRDHISITLKRRGASGLQHESKIRQLTFPDVRHAAIYSLCRDIYYRDPALFGSQAPVDQYVDDIVCTFGGSRSSMNVSAAAKGLVAGPVTFCRRDGSTSAISGDGEGILIPELREILSVHLSAVKWILVIEKEATFRTVACSEFWRMKSKQGIIITGKGYPDVATRALLHLLSSPSPRNDFVSPPVFGLVDFDPDGVTILSIYKYGSIALAHESDKLRVPSLRWLGLQSKQLVTRSTGTHESQGLLNLNQRDRKKAQKLLERQTSLVQDNGTLGWRAQLQQMLILNVKAEIQLLCATDFIFAGWFNHGCDLRNWPTTKRTALKVDEFTCCGGRSEPILVSPHDPVVMVAKPQQSCEVSLEAGDQRASGSMICWQVVKHRLYGTPLISSVPSVAFPFPELKLLPRLGKMFPRYASHALAMMWLAAFAHASPTPVEFETVTKVAERQAASNSVAILNESQLSAAFASLPADGQSLSAAITAVSAIFTNIIPAPGPTAASQLASEFQKVTVANPQDIFESGAQILLNGLAGGDYADISQGYLLESNTNNLNLRQPATKIYPKASPDDAPYSLSESDLRKVINIPLGFTYGKIQPVIFLPGTGALAGQNFEQKIGDPVYVNLPGQNLADIQVAAEYAAYAVNYISGITGGKNVSTVSWSAGSLDGQWATKYWPSTRSKISDRICLSADYHGTVEAQLLCPGFTTPGCTPAIAQQNYNSTFIRTLRNNGGDSAFVPTTNIYTIFDEIVEDPNASGALNDARGVGVTNNEIQATCFAALPGGAPYFEHALVLANALGYALAVDALTHAGPGQLSRINTTYQCDQFLTPGLSLADALATFALIPIAAVNVVAFQPKVATEPPIKAYAQKDIPQ
nr:isoform 2 of meiotic recombination protein spo11 [Quercus suber]